MAKLMAESNLDANKINVVVDDLRSDLCDMNHCDWYTNVIYYLQHMEAPPFFPKNVKRSTKLQAIRYIIVQGKLLWRNFEGVLIKKRQKKSEMKCMLECVEDTIWPKPLHIK